MTLKQLYLSCEKQLEFTECGEFEALCLFNDLLNISKQQIYLNNRDALESEKSMIDSAILRRKKGEPLQYILGKWDFYDLTFKVGEGVLIPRPETEMLVDFALEKLKNISNPVVYDLCAGTGCIGLTIAKHRPDSIVYLLEKEDKAFQYLLDNKEHLGLENVKLINGDLFTVDLSSFPNADILISNPPYIDSCEIPKLQKEVQFEPVTALDGGNDGLDFYRCIADRWSSKVKFNGYIALECGEQQSLSIIEIFADEYKEKEIILTSTILTEL